MQIKKGPAVNILLLVFVLICFGVLAAAAKNFSAQDVYRNEAAPVAAAAHVNTERPGGSKVYMTKDISDEGLMAVYRALGVNVTGKAAIKVHFGEPGNQYFVRPEFMRSLARETNGTFVDSNLMWGTHRRTSPAHLRTARQHGFTFAPVEILDTEGEVKIPIHGGTHTSEALFGSGILKYDWIISVAHFKGHSGSGFGGTFKNLAVGIATPEGKRVIHNNSIRRGTGGHPFLEKVVEYNKALIDSKPGRLVYINFVHNLSVDCDCVANAPSPSMQDIGILASLDPVALEKASLDLVYAHPVASERRALVERIESRNGAHQIDHAEKVGMGSRFYELIKL